MQSNLGNSTRFDRLFTSPALMENFWAIRHDVDRKVNNSFRMAEVEAELGLKSCYYFRTRPHVFKPEIIKAIAGMGHEIGYHYECLSDTKGDIPAAIEDFARNLEMLRKYADVKTCCMHGRPMLKIDNRDMWKSPENHALLKERFGLLGELYLDIDYSDIAYITDSGRNWSTSRGNVRDNTNSKVTPEFKSGAELLQYFEQKPHSRLVFQIHPERWDEHLPAWLLQFAKDTATANIKNAVKLFRGKK